jgi:ketosteroid isomerase-like protein
MHAWQPPAGSAEAASAFDARRRPGLPHARQDWSLRVTWVFRHEGAEWRLAHRHADPLVHGISQEQLAAIARGELGA